jgi:DNA-binding NarL/FixJ family response regulator
VKACCSTVLPAGSPSTINKIWLSKETASFVGRQKRLKTQKAIPHPSAASLMTGPCEADKFSKDCLMSKTPSLLDSSGMLLPLSPTRILVVDDFAPFRAFVLSLFAESTEFKVIGEAADGLEAVHTAEQLMPDLILLDIGLPTLNGIDAARQICQLAPDSKILFLSQESSADVVREALSVGAMGYVVKVDAGDELLAAVQAVRQGKRFVSSGLTGNFSDAAEPPTPDGRQLKAAPRSVASAGNKIPRSREAQFD